MCSVVRKRHHLYDPRETHSSKMMRFSAAMIAMAVLVVVETRAAPVSPTTSGSPSNRHVSDDQGNDVQKALDQFASLVISAVTRLSSGPRNTADLGGGGTLAAKAVAEVTSPQPTDTKNSRSSAGGIGNMVRQVIGKFNHDSGHRTSVVPTLIDSATT